ncbi:MAG: hypothetical protein AAF541_11585 [Pseudomonadota bacterium]
MDSNSAKQVLQAALAVVLLTSGLTAAAQNLYRYKDESGTIVISQSIPVDRVPHGYEVLDGSGRVTKKVEPQLSEEEYQAKRKREQAMADCSVQLKRVNKAYQTLDDINYAEQQSLASIDTSINNAKANLIHAQNQRKALEAQAAQKDIEGKRIPEVLLSDIEKARTQERNLEEEIESRQSEKLEQSLHYRYDRKIFELPDCENGLPPR